MSCRFGIKNKTTTNDTLALVSINQIKRTIMKLSDTLTHPITEVADNNIIFQVYGMDSEGLNFTHEIKEFTNFEKALMCYNSIELEKGFRKNLVLVIKNADGLSIKETDIFEEEREQKSSRTNMDNIEITVLKLRTKKKIHTKKLTALLDSLYNKLTMDCSELKIRTICETCAGCDQPSHNIIFANIRIGTSSPCFPSPVIWLKKQLGRKIKWIPVFVQGSGKLSDYGTSHKRDILRSLTLLLIALRTT